MKCFLYVLSFLAIGLLGCSMDHPPTILNNKQTDSILKIEMGLSALGVESDDAPNINVIIDFIADTSRCEKSFYNPAHKSSIYSLRKDEMHLILELLQIPVLEKIKKKYTSDLSDQPSSITKIYTTKKVYIIDDYALQGDYPLQKIYSIVYK